MNEEEVVEQVMKLRKLMKEGFGPMPAYDVKEPYFAITEEDGIALKSTSQPQYEDTDTPPSYLVLFTRAAIAALREDRTHEDEQE